MNRAKTAPIAAIKMPTTKNGLRFRQ